MQGDKSQLPSAQTVETLKTMINWDRVPAKANSLGVFLRLSQFDKRRIGDSNYIVYRAYAAGAPTNQNYKALSWTLGTPVQQMPGKIWVNKHGLLMRSEPTKEQQNADSVPEENEFDFVIQAAKGEPRRFILGSEDTKLIIMGTAVPYPFEVKDQACSVQVLLASPDGDAFILKASGFAGQIEAQVDSTSGGLHQMGKYQTSPTGEFITILFPFVEGKDRGVAEVHISAPACSLAMNLPWGKDSYHVE
jgi:hypothetical protein